MSAANGMVGDMADADRSWNRHMREQLSWHWDAQLRSRLDGMTDEEYRWEPAPGSWNVRPRGTGDPATSFGAGAMTLDFAFPPPDPAPLTTIAWRLVHVTAAVLGLRNASHFGAPAIDFDTFPYAATADDALRQLDAAYATWMDGVESLGEDGLWRPVGDAEGAHAADPYCTLVLHIHREVIHHLAEVCLLRDLYRHTVLQPEGRTSDRSP